MSEDYCPKCKFHYESDFHEQNCSSSGLSACSGADAQRADKRDSAEIARQIAVVVNTHGASAAASMVDALANAVSPRSSDGNWVDEAIKQARNEIGWLEAVITYLESLKENRLQNPQGSHQ